MEQRRIHVEINKSVRYAGRVYKVKEIGERRLKLQDREDKSLVIGVKPDSALLEEIVEQSAIVIESTPNSGSGEFYNRWQQIGKGV